MRSFGCLVSGWLPLQAAGSAGRCRGCKGPPAGPCVEHPNLAATGVWQRLWPRARRFQLQQSERPGSQEGQAVAGPAGACRAAESTAGATAEGVTEQRSDKTLSVRDESENLIDCRQEPEYRCSVHIENC